MEQEIEVAANLTTVNKRIVKVDLPTESKFFMKNDDGIFFPRGIVLFAILQKYVGSYKSYLLLEIERNKQDSNDFVPSDDCKQDTWLKYSGLRQKAFNIITKKDYEFKEITEEEFETRREELLNSYKK